jgi:8-oxo-dGTP pyrophosphatase MutT (NUDIX family)
MGLKSWIVWKGKDLGYGFLCKYLWPRASAAALVVEDKKLLAIDTGDYLMLPGGGLEHGETFIEAAKRETLEETGYRIHVVEKLYEGINSVGGAEFLYRAELSGREQVHDGNWEGQPIWINIDEIENRTWRHNRDVKAILDGKQS